MKFHVSICCLLVTESFASFSIADNDEDENYGRNEIVNDAERWRLEFEDFEDGLKILNDNGQEVELTKEDMLSDESKDKYLLDEIFIHLYTKENLVQNEGISGVMSKVSIQKRYKPEKPTIFISHGWKENAHSRACTVISKAYLKNNDVNVIVVDWRGIAALNYTRAARLVESVGKQVARIIDELTSVHRLGLKLTTFVGYSLGAHVMGIAGRHVRGTVNTIFGLDPANQMFKHAPPAKRISTGDAEHVQIIHTNGGYLGIWEAIGHSDFYPNGGASQVGCITQLGACSHKRAWEYFAESLDPPKYFRGCNTPTMENVQLKMCGQSDSAYMGGLSVDPAASGMYLFRTNPTSPYAVSLIP